MLPEACSVTRSKLNSSINFKKVCMFCEKEKHKGCKSMVRVEYQRFWETLDTFCTKRDDNYLRLKVCGDFSKLPALEARYHKSCHAAYIKQAPPRKLMDSLHMMLLFNYLKKNLKTYYMSKELYQWIYY